MAKNGKNHDRRKIGLAVIYGGRSGEHEVSLQSAASVMAALDRDELWSPAVVLGAMHAWRSGFVEAGGTAAFTLDVAYLIQCES